MRFNERQLFDISRKTPSIEGTLQYMKQQRSDWYQQPAFKERVFKLVNNLLFYYRVSDLEEPLGILVLENVQVAYENPGPGPAFAFSLCFNDGKYIFACRCHEDLNRWVAKLKIASYEYWRSLFTILQAKINLRNGRDPGSNMTTRENVSYEVETRQLSKSTFYSRSSTVSSVSSISSTGTIETKVISENLIDL